MEFEDFRPGVLLAGVGYLTGFPVAGPVFGPSGGQDARHFSSVDFFWGPIFLIVAFKACEKNHTAECLK